MARILIIDDDAQLRSLLRRILTRAGYETAEAGDGRQGAALVESFDPALVMSDIVMPEQEGIETIQQIRRAHPHLPILAMSGKAIENSGNYLELASHLGATKTIAKPFRPKELLDIVGEMLGVPTEQS